MAIGSILTAKQLAATYQPILLVTITQNDGTVLNWCTHDFTDDSGHSPARSFRYNGTEYVPIITNQDLAATQALSEDGVDITPTVTLRIADPQQEIFQNFELNSTLGFKGGIMVLTLILVDMAAYVDSGIGSVGNFAPSYSSDSIGAFIGQCNPATQDNDEELVISAVSKFNMRKIMLPTVAVQKTCPWTLPRKYKVTDANGILQTIDEWVDGANDPTNQLLYSCGFDNGITRGNVIFPSDGLPLADADSSVTTWANTPLHCRYTKPGCIRLGMYVGDDSGRRTGSFGGFQWDLAANNLMSWKGKSYIEDVNMVGTNDQELAKYSNYVPLIYGTTWVDAIPLNVLGDPNSSRGEALVCLAYWPVGDVISVVVNDTFLPPGSFRYTGYTQDELQQIFNFLNGSVPYFPNIYPTVDNSTVNIVGASNTAPILVDTQVPHGLHTGDWVYIKDVNNNPSYAVYPGLFSTNYPLGTNSTNGFWSIIVNSPTQVALVGSAGNQTYSGGGTLSTNLPNTGNSPFNGSVFNTDRWAAVNWGGRNGSPNNDAIFNSLGDPYGNYCVIEWVVPSATAQSNSSPRIRVLIDGPALPVFYGANPATIDYVALGAPFNENPVWQILDLLTKCNWTYDLIDLASFVTAAAICDASVSYQDQFGLTQSHQRFACSFAIRTRKSAADILKSLRQSCGAILIPNNNGKLKILIKRDIATQQPATMPGSNNDIPILSGAPGAGNGHLAYDFTESDILRNGNKTTFKVSQLPIQQAANRISVSFQDKENAYQQDSLTIIDDYDYGNVGEVDTQLQMEGPNTFDHCQRIMTTMLAEIHKGNPAASSHGTLQFTFDSTIKAAHLNVGDICRLTFAQRGINQQLVRLTSKAPTQNFEGVRLTFTWHDDIWYSDAFGQGLIQDSGTLGKTTGSQLPNPWQPWQEQPSVGDPLEDSTNWNFAVAQSYKPNADGSKTGLVNITGKLPINQLSQKLRRPVVPTQGSFSQTGGTFVGPAVYYVSFCSIDDGGLYSAPSQPVKINVNVATTAASLTVNNLIFDGKTASVAAFAGSHPSAQTFIQAYVPASLSKTSLTLNGAKTATWAIPDTKVNKIKIQAKQIFHDGVIGTAVTGVSANKITIGGNFTTNQWIGRQCSVISNAQLTNGGDIPIWNFKVTASDSTSVTVTPDPMGEAIQVQVGDAFIMRMQPQIDIADSSTSLQRIVDPQWVNIFNEFQDPLNIVDVQDNGDGTAEVYADSPHGFDGTRNIYIANVAGSTEVNGEWSNTQYVVDSPTTIRVTVAISAPYASGGVMAQQGDGLVTNAEVGNIFRVISNTGAGQQAVISSNDGTSITLSQPLSYPIAADSICIIEEATWRYSQTSNIINNSANDTAVQFTFPVQNFVGDQLLIMGVTLDAMGNECPEAFCPIRECYMVGASGQTFIRDLLIKGIITDDPMTAGQDVMANHYRVRCNTGEFVVLLDTAIQAKDPPSGSSAIFDVLVSTDGGVTWTTIYATQPVLANGASAADFDDTHFVISRLYRDNLIRFDIVQVGANNSGGQVEIDIKGKVFA